MLLRAATGGISFRVATCSAQARGAEAPAGEDGSTTVGSAPGRGEAESFPGLFSGNHINSLFLKHRSLDLLVTAGWPVLTDTTMALEGYGDYWLSTWTSRVT